MIVLASSSPRRAALLEQIGIPFTVAPVDVDEQPHDGESADDYVVRLAEAKARARPAAEPVLGADTAVVVDDEILGKPRDRADGERMLRALSGRAHEVLTAVAVAHGGRVASRLSRSVVHFATLGDDDIARYWQTGEGVDKAGSYGIQGIGGIFVDRIDGSYSGIVGLPLKETEALLRAFGVPTWRHRPRVVGQGP